ncbi:MAG: hypothetical protein NZ781_11495, partial [Armatimonadetes bacterium]|nr:hypothetical protein [Armatimonadota bacterium]
HLRICNPKRLMSITTNTEREVLDFIFFTHFVSSGYQHRYSFSVYSMTHNAANVNWLLCFRLSFFTQKLFWFVVRHEAK